MSVAISAPKRIVSETHVVDVNVRYGGEESEEPGGDWSFVLSRRTGRWTGETEVKEGISWHYFSGLATPAQYKKVKKWLGEQGMADLYDEVKSVVKSLNKGMKDDFARWGE